MNGGWSVNVNPSRGEQNIARVGLGEQSRLLIGGSVEAAPPASSTHPGGTL
jgi:hypothetical protein